LTEEAKRLEAEGLHDDPLMTPLRKEEMLKEYNKAEQALLDYRKKEKDRHSAMVRKYPGLKEVYGTIGYEFDDSEPVVEPIAEPATIEPIQEKPVEPNYPDWLKD
jgi:hypothetical protein